MKKKKEARIVETEIKTNVEAKIQEVQKATRPLEKNIKAFISLLSKLQERSLTSGVTHNLW